MLAIRTYRIKLTKLSPFAVKAFKIIFPNCTLRHLCRKSESYGPCLKQLLRTILTSSFPYCPCQKDEWAKPWNLVTKLHSSSIPRNKISLTSPATFHFHLLFSYTFRLSLQSLFEELNVCFFLSEQHCQHTRDGHVCRDVGAPRFMIPQCRDTLLPEISRLVHLQPRPEICVGMSLGQVDQGCTSSEHLPSCHGTQ